MDYKERINRRLYFAENINEIENDDVYAVLEEEYILNGNMDICNIAVFNAVVMGSIKDANLMKESLELAKKIYRDRDVQV